MGRVISKNKKYIAASIKERLKNISKQSGREYYNLLRLYVQERFLYRLSKSIFANNFILKGALLFVAHNISSLRPTRDIDFLGASISNNIIEIEKSIKEILKLKFNDGLQFDLNEIKSEEIVKEGNYHGVRIKCFAYLENSKVRIQIDIGFDDKIIGGPTEIEFPTLLNLPAPQLKVYSIETAIAEKFEAIVSLQLQTSRFKDFYDILFFAENHRFNNQTLKKSMEATFQHRKTELTLRNHIYEDNFKNNKQLQKNWIAFLNRNKLTTETNFSIVIEKIKAFIEPVLSK
ncbi:MAG: nucleotidyl transferase AbiEii/AbiGii toxin family protein [Melioribacteraceae bacterium]|nr:nucleotidyl transferase AbiEii/AbiGii toxin family protein [Melioribacteraceae bacterium]